jgi:N-dimethylarginine dimethylaminohydrolase
MYAPLRRVLVRRPATEGDFAAAGWRPPDPGLLLAQHEAFCALLAGPGCQVEVAAALDGQVDATYIRDPGLVTRRGGVLFRMAKPARQREPEHLGPALEAAGVPVVARLDGTARADGGDFVWLDPQTLMIGRSYRTNAEGVAQLRAIMAAEQVTVVPVRKRAFCKPRATARRWLSPACCNGFWQACWRCDRAPAPGTQPGPPRGSPAQP